MDVAYGLHPLSFGLGRPGPAPLANLYIAPTPAGTWRVSVAPGGYGTEHPDRESAITAGRRASRRQWERTGEPCLLRVRNVDGTTAVIAGFRDAV